MCCDKDILEKGEEFKKRKRKDNAEKKLVTLKDWRKKGVEEWTEQCVAFKHTSIKETS
jgi:hypothetical protein